MAVYKAEEWQGSSGQWYCANTSNLGNSSAYWYHQAKIWGKSGDEFVQMLVEKFHCNHISYNLERDTLVFSWDVLADMRKYKNALNAQARKVAYEI